MISFRIKSLIQQISKGLVVSEAVKVFVSYSWGVEDETKIVDAIEQQCNERDIAIIRDRNEMKHGDLIREFIERLTGGEHVITVFSKSYFRSEWCMLELLLIWQKGNFQQRTHPVIADDCQLSDLEYRLLISDFWVDKHSFLDKMLKKRDPSSFIEEFKQLKRLRDISQNINDVMNFAKDRLTTPLKLLKEQNYSQLIDGIVENTPVQNENITAPKPKVALETNKTLSLPISEQWLCFDLTTEDDIVTATSVDKPSEKTQLKTSEVFNNFPEENLAVKLFPLAFSVNSDCPIRLRVRTEDNDLAMLPWAQLHQGTIIEVSSKATHYRPGFDTLNITNPLALIPDGPKRINSSSHYRVLHEYFNGYLNIRGPVPKVSSRKSFLRALKHHEPDLLYIYASAKNGKIALDAPSFLDPDDEFDLSLEALGECIQEANLRPVVVISLMGEELTKYPKTLVENSRVLWIQSTASKLSSKSKVIENTLAETLEKVGLESDLVALINDTFSKDRTIKQHLWVSGQSPQLETQGLSLIHRLRAALLRVMLGREDLKGKLYSEIQKPEHFNANYCLTYVITGDLSSCPFDVPSQLQQRLDQDETAKSLPLLNFPLSLTIDIDSDAEEVIAELFEGSLLDRSGHVEETFHGELERRGLSESDSCIAINWSINVLENSSIAISEWITALANLIRDEITPYIPPQTILLNSVCIQSPNQALAQQIQDTVNKTLQPYRKEGIRLVRIADALGKLQDYEIIDFFEDNPHWQKTLKFETYSIDPSNYTDWIYKHSNQGEFEKTVNLIWQQYQNDYNDYQA